jgi:hypothetical protein
MMTSPSLKGMWPEDPAWPDPFGDDPYDISSTL